MKHFYKPLFASVMAAALGVVAFVGAPQSAKASSNDYCREYTRTVYIGGRAQDAYGSACLQQDGSWMIVGEDMGNDIPDNVNDVAYVIHDTRRDFVPTRVVYYNSYPRYNHHNVAPDFVWYHDGHYVNYRDNYKNRGYGHGKKYGWHDRRDDRYDDRHDDDLYESSDRYEHFDRYDRYDRSKGGLEIVYRSGY